MDRDAYKGKITYIKIFLNPKKVKLTLRGGGGIVPWSALLLAHKMHNLMRGFKGVLTF